MTSSFFFFNDTATTEIYTLSLHDALPIFFQPGASRLRGFVRFDARRAEHHDGVPRSEEHTSELQSHLNLVCRLLLEKKKPKHQGSLGDHAEMVPYIVHPSLLIPHHSSSLN